MKFFVFFDGTVLQADEIIDEQYVPQGISNEYYLCKNSVVTVDLSHEFAQIVQIKNNKINTFKSHHEGHRFYQVVLLEGVTLKELQDTINFYVTNEMKPDNAVIRHRFAYDYEKISKNYKYIDGPSQLYVCDLLEFEHAEKYMTKEFIDNIIDLLIKEKADKRYIVKERIQNLYEEVDEALEEALNDALDELVSKKHFKSLNEHEEYEEYEHE